MQLTQSQINALNTMCPSAQTAGVGDTPTGLGSIIDQILDNLGIETDETSTTIGAGTNPTNVAGALNIAGNVAVATNKFTIAAATGNTSVGGTLSVSGASSLGSVSIADGANISFATTTGSMIGTAATQKLAFYGATPVVKPTAYTQTYATAAKTLPNATAAALTDSSGGTASTTLAAITAGASYAQTDMTAVKNAVASLAAQVNAIEVDSTAHKQVTNALIDDLQALGFVG